MSKVTVVSRPNRIVIASKGVQGAPGPTGDVTPEAEAARDAAIAAANAAASSESAAQGYASTASDAASAASQSADAAAASESAAGGSATTASNAASTASNAADTATSAATAASGSASAAAASESAASGSATTATGAATTATTAASTATQAASDAQGSATSAAASANAALVAGKEFGVLVARDAGIVTGGYPATRSAWGAMTMGRFFAEGMGGDATVAVRVNDALVLGPITVSEGARITQPVSIVLAQGDTVTFDIIGQGAKRLWAQIDGGVA